MKRFKTKKNKYKTDIILALISVLSFLMLIYYNNKLSPKIISIIENEIDEKTTLIIKKNIAPINYKINDLIIINLNNKSEITYVDIDTEYAYKLTYEIVGKIQNEILNFKNGNIESDEFLKSKNNNIYLLPRLGLYDEGVLFNSLGPKIPVKISFYEYVLGTIDVEVKDYGINNALLNVYLTISLKNQLIMPFKKNSINKDYKMILGSKVIMGTVPSIFGTNISKTSSFEVEV